LAVWCEDEAGPFQAVPQPGGSWRPRGHPATRPHEYVRGGTCKILTLFHPASGQVHLQPVGSCTNPILHGWLKERLEVILAALPPPAAPTDATVTRGAWEAWRDGLAERFTLPDALPPPRMLLVWDNLTGHKSAEMVVWLCRHGITPLYTPLGGSWLNMAESIQRILKRRTLDGQHPRSPAEIGAWFQQTAQAWNQRPTPFLWNGKRRQRRRKRSGDGHIIGGSGAHTQQPLLPHGRGPQEWHSPRQVTH
jgi:transposase